MYYRGTKKEDVVVPFEIKCTNCGSHDVNVIACEYYDLCIECNKCGSHLETGSYNETEYET